MSEDDEPSKKYVSYEDFEDKEFYQSVGIYFQCRIVDGNKTIKTAYGPEFNNLFDTFPSFSVTPKEIRSKLKKERDDLDLVEN